MIKANISWSAKQIAKACELGSMTFENAIQRGHVWDKARQSLLVDSILRNFPIPPMYTIKTDIDAPDGCKKGSKVFDCIDGKQRCEAIRAFRNNEFALEGCEPFLDINGNEVDLNGKTFSELDEDWQDAFDGYTLTVYFFTDITDDEVCDMMSRLNNGKPLSGIENARIKAKNLPAITELANHPLFTENMSKSAIMSYNNEDVVIKMALQIFEEEFELSAKNAKSAYENFEFTETQKEKIVQIIRKMYKTVSLMKDNTKASILKKTLKKTNLVTVLYFFSMNMEEDETKLAEYLSVFFGGKSESLEELRGEYNETCTNGTNHANNVLARNEAFAKAYVAYGENI